MKPSNKLAATAVIALLWMGLAFPSILSAQDITGTWHGKLALPNGTLTIVFHISRPEGQGAYTTTMDSPDQGANGIKTQSTTFDGSTLTIQIPLIGASYQGKPDAQGTAINGTFTQGISLPLNLQKGEAARPRRPQEPRPPFPYRSEEVTVRNTHAAIDLAGTLTLPATAAAGAKCPAVVMVTGSGPQNRDEEIMGHKPFLVIADYLTRHGIAVLRCDDRGTAASQGKHDTATNDDFATDTEAMLGYLRGRKEIDTKKIGIIGHSAGAAIAFLVAKDDPAVAFVVSLAGPGVRSDSLMLRQAELISKSQGMPDAEWQKAAPAVRHRYAILRQTDKPVDVIRKELYADIANTLPPEQLKAPDAARQISAQVATMTSPWYLHFMRYDPTADLRRVKCPVLALNGERDIQVDAAMNLTAIRQHIGEGGNKRVTTKAYPGLNHLFQTCKHGTVEEYGQLEETISPAVLEDMLAWIRQQVNGGKP